MATNEAQTETDLADDEDGEATVKRKLPLKLIIMAVGGLGGLVVLGGAGGGVYHFLFAGRGEEAAATAAPLNAPAFLDMPEILVNLSTSGGTERTQYLKVKVVLELADQEMAVQIQP